MKKFLLWFRARRWPLFRAGVVIAWLILFGAVLQREYLVKSLDLRERQLLREARQETWQGIYFQGERIGYARTRLEDEAGGLILDQEAYLLLNVLNKTHPVEMRVTARLTDQSRLRDFSFALSSPFYRMRADGRLDSGRLRYTLTTGQETVSREALMAEAPFIALPARSYLLQGKPAPGDRMKLPYFDPISLAARETVLEYRGREKILIRGRVEQLHRFTETVAGIRVNSWLDDGGKVIKEESPAGFVFLAEPKFQAMDVRGGREILGSVSAPLLGQPPAGWQERPEIRYRLKLPEGAEFEALNQGRQQFAAGYLTIRREALPAGEILPCAGEEENLAATVYLQAASPAIVERSMSLAGGHPDALEKVRALAGWVFATLEKRPVIGIPDAVATLKSGVGDCNEHAALFAALARAAGIPARIAAGVVLHENAFYYHAWNEVCLNGQWLSLDTTRDQFPADVSHIRFVTGETAEQIRISALIGALAIEVMQ